jgi:hypothetical protein
MNQGERTDGSAATPKAEIAAPERPDRSQRSPLDRGHASPLGRRRSPATTAKIVTVGASTTAMLGMIAGYGITERMAASKPTLVADDRPPATPATATRSAPAPTITTAAPQVIVVIIDSATGKPISPADPSALDPLESPQTPATGASTPAAPDSTAPATALGPVPAPQVVDLAVPVPPPPAPAPAAPTAPAAPGPAPQASSGGS